MKLLKLVKKSHSFEQRNSKVFDDIKDWWDPFGNMKTLHSFNTFRLNYITNFLRKYNLSLINKSCLDVGCGGGLLTESIARLGANITGIDPNKTSYNIAKSHLDLYKGEEEQEMKNKIDYKNIKIEDLPEEKYDFIFAFEVIEHIENQKNFISNISKRLKLGGTVFISTINKNIVSKILLLDIAENILGIIPKGTHEYEKFLCPELLEEYLQEESLQILDKKGVCYNPLSNSMCEIDSLISNYIVASVKI